MLYDVVEYEKNRDGEKFQHINNLMSYLNAFALLAVVFQLALAVHE